MALTVQIIRSDLFRLMILFAEGGIYSDSDTICLKPIVNWLGNDSRHLVEDLRTELVVSIEMDLLDCALPLRGPTDSADDPASVRASWFPATLVRPSNSPF